MDETLSPDLQEKLTYLGTVLSSFPEAHRATEAVLEEVFGIKRIERLTERIGGERVAERAAAVEAWQRSTLVEKETAPPGVKPPAVAVVLPDGGRLQLCEKNEESSTHWHEYKAGCLLDLESQTHPLDPCPDVPSVFLQRDHIRTLTCEIGKKAADPEQPAEIDSGRATAEETSPANSSPADPRNRTRPIHRRRFSAGMWWRPAATVRPSERYSPRGRGSWGCSPQNARLTSATGRTGCGVFGNATSNRSGLCQFWTLSMH